MPAPDPPEGSELHPPMMSGGGPELLDPAIGSISVGLLGSLEESIKHAPEGNGAASVGA